jgi:branched-chain amino acid aminotransferase
VNPASEYIFHVFPSPVGQYLGGDRLKVLSAAHRAAPYGIGAAKAAGNYSASLRPGKLAHEAGYTDVLYLDARENRYVEECSGASFLAILKDGVMVAPSLGSILPGITRDSIITIARELFGWIVVERKLSLDEVIQDAAEAFYTGTATILAPVTTLNVQGVDHAIGDGKPGPRAMALRQALDEVQAGDRPDLWGWVVEI